MVLVLTTFTLFLSALATQCQGQLTGGVGPTTKLSSKTHTCSVLDYGGSVGSNDIGPAISKAFTVRISIWSFFWINLGPSLSRTACSRTVAQRSIFLLVSISKSHISKGIDALSGNYNMQTWVNLSGGTHWALRLDGWITRTCKALSPHYPTVF